MSEEQERPIQPRLVFGEAAPQHFHLHVGGPAERVPAQPLALPPASSDGPPWWKIFGAAISGLILIAIAWLGSYIFEVDRRIGRLEHTAESLNTDVKRIIVALEGYGIDVPEYVQNEHPEDAQSD